MSAILEMLAVSGHCDFGGVVMRVLFAAVAALAIAAPVRAGEIENVRSFDIAVSGAIRQHCALGNVPNMDFGNLERRGLGIDREVAFDCNMPFTMTIKGAKGALMHTTMPNGQGPYGGQLPYSIGVKMPVRHPAMQMIDRTFNSRQLVAGGIISSNGGIATDGMHLAIELGSPSGEAGLLAGDYSETITITVSPI